MLRGLLSHTERRERWDLNVMETAFLPSVKWQIEEKFTFNIRETFFISYMLQCLTHLTSSPGEKGAECSVPLRLHA